MPRRRYDLGVKYDTGVGVPQDKAEAAKWYRKAAENGDATARSMLGYMYETGEGAPKDPAKAVEWYRKAAERGDAYAQNSLGAMYGAGEGVAQDDAEAAKCYRKAAEQGDTGGMNGLAWTLVTVPAMLNAKEGLAWATKAAKAKPDDGDVLDTLACAYAANGDFDDAIKTEQQALELTKDLDLKQNLEEMIGVFQKKMTYIEYQKSKAK